MNSLIGDSSLNESTILHVVMNLDNWHWNYLTVVFSTRTICVWDSLSSVDSFVETKEALLQNLFTVFTWEYERRNKKKLSGEWKRKDLDVPQQKEERKVSCGVYCMVFLMRGFLEGLFSVAPFASDVDLSGDGDNTFNKQLLRNLRGSIADVIMRSSTVLSIMSFFVPEYMYKSVHKNLRHTCYFSCKSKNMAARTRRPIV
jgi:Ulp1 family protease